MRLKRFLSIALLGVVLLQSFLALVFWQFQMECLHAKNWYNSASVEVFEVTLTPEEYANAKVNNHEIIINHRICDILRITASSKGITLAIIVDDEENLLMEKVVNYMSSKNPLTKSSSSLNLMALFVFSYFEPQQKLSFYNVAEGTELCFLCTLISAINHASITTPPPRYNFCV